MSTNADNIQALINATPYKWPTNRLAKACGIQTGSAHRACATLERYGLIQHKRCRVGSRIMSVWYRKAVRA